jgi:hypothetical protein
MPLLFYHAHVNKAQVRKEPSMMDKGLGPTPAPSQKKKKNLSSPNELIIYFEELKS